MCAWALVCVCAGPAAGGDAGSPSWVEVVVKLGDLGLAKAVADGRTHHSSGAGTGTALTMAPQAFLRGKYDAPGDVYSWAKCICWVVVDALRLPRSEAELRSGVMVRAGGVGAVMSHVHASFAAAPRRQPASGPPLRPAFPALRAR